MAEKNTCPNCGFENTSNAQFCRKCGQGLAQPLETKTQETVFCPHCGQRIYKEAGFCGYCGHVLEQQISGDEKKRGPVILIFLLVIGALLVLIAAGFLRSGMMEFFPGLPFFDQSDEISLENSTDDLPSTPAVGTIEAIAAITPSERPSPTTMVTITPLPTVHSTETPFPTVVDLSATSTVVHTATATPKPISTLLREITINASLPRTETGLRVQAGQVIIVEYISGTWQAGPSPAWAFVGPEGDGQVLTKQTFPVVGYPIMTLIGGIDINPPFAIGNRLEFIGSEDGNLWLGPNDDNVDDNSGQLLVQVSINDVVDTNTESVVCPGAFQTRLAIGMSARTANYQLNVREGPGESYRVLNRLMPGRLVEVLQGPVCKDEQLWYLIRSEEFTNRSGEKVQVEGWAVEESGYTWLLEPTN